MLGVSGVPSSMIHGLQNLLIADKRISLSIHHTFEDASLWHSPIKFFILFILKMHTMSIDGITWFPIVPLVLLFTANRANLSSQDSVQRMLIELYLGSLLGVVVELTLKPLFRRTRPPLKTNEKPRFIAAENFSFPSGHSLRAFYVAAAISLRWADMLQFRYGIEPRVLIPVLYLWAIIVALSRVALGRHFLLDVMGGAAAGILCEILLAAAAAVPNMLGLVF
jgi:membrane-associated phospholipid phosphatase